jgi:hypothetical protein
MQSDAERMRGATENQRRGRNRNGRIEHPSVADRQRRIREQLEADLKAKYGAAWVEENSGLLDAQWEFLTASKFV